MSNLTANQTEIKATKRDDIKKVDPRNIEIEAGFNKRVDYGDTLAMAHSVVSVGVLEAVIGYKKRAEDKYVLTDGHRRMAGVHLAIKLHNEGVAGFEDISKLEFIRLAPCSDDLKERLYIMAITGEGKKPLTDLEKASMYHSLIEVGKEEGKKRGEVIKEIVAKLGVSTATIYNLLQLNDVSEDIKDFIASGQISGEVVRAIIKEVKDPEEQKKMVLEAVYDAEEKAKASGGTKKAKATAANVKGLKPKTPMQKLLEVQEKLIKKDVINVRTRLLDSLIAALEEKESINRIVELFS